MWQEKRLAQSLVMWCEVEGITRPHCHSFLRELLIAMVTGFLSPRPQAPTPFPLLSGVSCVAVHKQRKIAFFSPAF